MARKHPYAHGACAYEAGGPSRNLQGALDGRGPAVFGQQAGMDVERAAARGI